MENSSVANDVYTNVTPTSSYCGVEEYVRDDHVGDFAAKVIQLVIGSVGVVDNLFVIVVFAFFIKIADKVQQA